MAAVNRTWGAAAGLLAGAVALGVAELTAAALPISGGPLGAPVVAVGEAAINLTPVPVKEFAIAHFGTHDKQALIAGILALLAAFAAVTGRWPCGGLASAWPGWRRSPRSAWRPGSAGWARGRRRCCPRWPGRPRAREPWCCWYGWDAQSAARRGRYWTQRGYAAQAPVKTESRIDVPRPLAQVKAGRTVVAGVAWAPHRGIAGVEVSVDDGAWQRARLAPGDLDTWRQWVWRWDATGPAPAARAGHRQHGRDADTAARPSLPTVT